MATDWKELDHNYPKRLEKFLMMMCQAGDAENELKLLTRYQKILRAIADEEAMYYAHQLIACEEKSDKLKEFILKLSKPDLSDKFINDQIDLTEENSHGNSTDVFWDGQAQAVAETAYECREFLKTL